MSRGKHHQDAQTGFMGDHRCQDHQEEAQFPFSHHPRKSWLRWAMPLDTYISREGALPCYLLIWGKSPKEPGVVRNNQASLWHQTICQ